MGLLSNLKNMSKDIVVSSYKIAFALAGYLPVRRNVIVFESFLGKQYSCNPRAIYEYLNENDTHYKMVWSVDKRSTNVFIEHQVPYMKRFTLKWLFTMATAQYWVSNSRLPLWIPKPKHTTYLQTWHGTPLKKLALDMTEVHMHGTDTKKYKQDFRQATKKWDYLISPNAYSTEIFQRAFDFTNEMVETGYPRNDFLFTHNNEETINNIKKRCQIPSNKKVILYAPTWRDDQYYGSGKYKFDIQLDLKKMKQSLGNDYVIILRMHYLVSENIDLSGYTGFAYDLSTHEDIRELYLISDMLITDYSSVFFDYANLKRPMIFYAYDMDSYRDKLRGFYFDFESRVPGPIVKTTEAVINTIHLFEENNYEMNKEFDSFYEQFCYLEDGFASKRVVEKVFGERITP